LIVNGDGLDDLIIGAYHAEPNGKVKTGSSFVVFGTADTDVIELSNVVSGSGGFVINGDKLEDFSGFSVSSAGDVNGDGLSDLIVGINGFRIGFSKYHIRSTCIAVYLRNTSPPSTNN
jgi:hypothetical protein